MGEISQDQPGVPGRRPFFVSLFVLDVSVYFFDLSRIDHQKSFLNAPDSSINFRKAGGETRSVKNLLAQNWSRDFQGGQNSFCDKNGFQTKLVFIFLSIEY